MFTLELTEDEAFTLLAALSMERQRVEGHAQAQFHHRRIVDLSDRIVAALTAEVV